jgi:hypothetical protein
MMSTGAGHLGDKTPAHSPQADNFTGAINGQKQGSN